MRWSGNWSQLIVTYNMTKKPVLVPIDICLNNRFARVRPQNVSWCFLWSTDMFSPHQISKYLHGDHGNVWTQLFCVLLNNPIFNKFGSSFVFHVDLILTFLLFKTPFFCLYSCQDGQILFLSQDNRNVFKVLPCNVLRVEMQAQNQCCFATSTSKYNFQKWPCHLPRICTF